MNFRKYEEMYKLLSQKKLSIGKNLSDELKCSKCKTILINPCQVCCGCRYCRHCIDEMIQNGDRFCIGNSDYCKNELLLNCTVDYRANKDVSMILVTCPKKSCSFESELINMGDHLRCCLKNSEFPLSSLDSVDMGMNRETVDEHNFIPDLELKILQPDLVNKEFRLLKLEIENLKREIDEIKESFDNRLEQLTTGIETSKSGMKREINVIGDCPSRGANIIANSNTAAIEEIQNKNVKKYLKVEISDKFQWNIGPTKEISTNKWIGSDFFSESLKSYKMRLWMWSDLWKLWIYFYVYPSAYDQDLTWPFNRNVTVKVFDRDDNSKQIFITKCCKISRPAKNSTEKMDPFLFYHNELENENLAMVNSTVGIFITNE